MANPIENAFARSALATFCLVLAIATWLGNCWHQKLIAREPASQPILSASDLSWLDVKRTPKSAKTAHEWWLRRFDTDAGAGVRALQSADLFSQLFPGYPASLRTNEKIWQNYFNHDFNLDTRVADLAADQEQMVMMPSLGCLDVFAGAGADVLLFGTSEAAQSLFPSRLALALGEKGRVLNCTRNGQLPSSLVRVAHELNKNIIAGQQPKARRAIWGYSVWLSYTSSPFRGAKWEAEKEQTDEWLRYQQAKKYPLLSFLRLRGSDFFNPPSWSAIETVEFGNWKRQQNDRKNFATALDWKTNSMPSGNLQINRENIAELNDLADHAEPAFWILEGQRETHCSDNSQARVEFNDAIDALLLVSDEVDVFVPPVTPLVSEASDACLNRSVKALLQSRASERVKVQFENWKAFNLTWSDYLRATSDPRILELNANHPNYGGAVKITDRVGNWVRNLP